MAGLGWQELVIVLVIIMIIFGAGKLPEIAKSLGQGVKEFREEAQAPVTPVSSQSTATATETTLRSDADRVADEAGRVAAEAEVKLDEAADLARAEAKKAEAATRDAI
jgi:sec-independent protein translocase protein TatA